MWACVTEASTYPVTLADAKAQCRIDDNDTGSDSLLDGFIAAANDVIGQMVGFPLGEEVWGAHVAGKTVVSVPLYPVTGLVSVGDNLEGFTLTRDGDIASISGPWPAEIVAVKVKVGGFVPPSIKHALLMLISHWYENRETASEKPLKELPFAVESLVSLYRRGWAKS